MAAKNKIPEEYRDKATKMNMPRKFSPMLATLTHDHFSSDEWIFERKWDGVRCIIKKNGEEVKLISRNDKVLNNTYPEIYDAMKEQKVEKCIVDGEIVTFEEDISSFSKLQNRMQIRDRQKALETGIPVCFYAFDLQYFEGYDVKKLPLRGRKTILKNGFEYNDTFRYTTHLNEEGEKFLREACRKGWEGLIAKHAGSEYSHSRSKAWLKFKCTNRQEFVIVGFTNPEGERVGFGALMIGFYDGDKLKYAGKVGTGYDDKTLKELSGKLKKITRKTPPVDEEVEEEKAHWVTPEMVCEVGFTEWTDDNMLRHPRYIGLRHDKNPKDVRKEG